MSDMPTKDEITEALAVIERATAHRKVQYTAAQTRAMTKEQVKEALDHNPAAFDNVSEEQES